MKTLKRFVRKDKEPSMSRLCRNVNGQPFGNPLHTADSGLFLDNMMENSTSLRKTGMSASNSSLPVESYGIKDMPFVLKPKAVDHHLASVGNNMSSVSHNIQHDSTTTLGEIEENEVDTFECAETLERRRKLIDSLKNKPKPPPVPPPGLSNRSNSVHYGYSPNAERPNSIGDAHVIPPPGFTEHDRKHRPHMSKAKRNSCVNNKRRSSRVLIKPDASANFGICKTLPRKEKASMFPEDYDVVEDSSTTRAPSYGFQRRSKATLFMKQLSTKLPSSMSKQGMTLKTTNPIFSRAESSLEEDEFSCTDETSSLNLSHRLSFDEDVEDDLNEEDVSDIHDYNVDNDLEIVEDVRSAESLLAVRPAILDHSQSAKALDTFDVSQDEWKARMRAVRSFKTMRNVSTVENDVPAIAGVESSEWNARLQAVQALRQQRFYEIEV